MSRRNLARHAGQESTHFESVDSFIRSKVPDGVITIDYNGSPLDILNQPGAHKTTIVTFHTALSPNMRTLPVFSGGGVTEGLGANLVFVSDPTLEMEDELMLAWFAGNSGQPLQRDLPAILRHILSSQCAEHVVFFGASGGGFAALYYSAFFPGSLAVPVNPQIVIKDYAEAAVLAYTSAAFGANGVESARAVLSEDITGDLRHIYRGGHSNTVAYVQNTMDTHHLYRHLAHFLRAAPSSLEMNLFTADWGKGHTPPPKEFIASLLSEVVSSAPEWGAALNRLGFTAAPTADHAINARELATQQPQ